MSDLQLTKSQLLIGSLITVWHIKHKCKGWLVWIQVKNVTLIYSLSKRRQRSGNCSWLKLTFASVSCNKVCGKTQDAFSWTVSKRNIRREEQSEQWTLLTDAERKNNERNMNENYKLEALLWAPLRVRYPLSASARASLRFRYPLSAASARALLRVRYPLSASAHITALCCAGSNIVNQRNRDCDYHTRACRYASCSSAHGPWLKPVG